MKLNKEDLKKKVNEIVTDNDVAIQLLEDIEDSMTETNESVIDETAKKELEEIKWKYEDLKSKYKERFLKGDDKEDKEEKVDDEEMKEEEVVDVKEI